MRATLLHIADCPGWERAAVDLRAALDATGNAEAEIVLQRIDSGADAAGGPFAGSPTIVVDGADLFPGTSTDELACRVYATPEGLRPSPTRQQIVDALTALGG